MKKLKKDEVELLLKKAYKCRQNILRMMKNAEGHIGGAFSSLDIITVLYNKILKHNPSEPKWPDRDRFILSAGHKCLALYTVLADQGYFDESILWTYGQFKTRVAMHPEEKLLPGVEFPTGSLGHGLPVGHGIALCAKLDKKNYKVFVMLGDGECQEGSIWEAAMSAGHYGTDNLIVILDRNGLQVNGPTEKIMNISPVEDKFKAFGWEVRTIDGHDYNQIYETLISMPFKKGKPSCIIAKTTKCKGLTFAEGEFQYHHWHCEPDKIDESLEIVKESLKKELERIK